jgi:hypothetical protein
MVKRIAIIFPDASISIMPGSHDSAQAINQARREVRLFNRHETEPAKMAQFGEIEINLMSFRETR